MLSLANLVLVTLASFRFGGQPAHLTRRPTATKFWGLDVSGGAGTISSPVLDEHPKNVSELATGLESFFNVYATRAPTWLLYSSIGIATRELTSRQAKELLPALVTDNEAATKANAIERKLRRNFDARVQRVLKPAGYGNAERVVKRFVDAELNDLASESISSPYDVVEHELTQELLEVVQAEVDYRIQGTISEAIQLNQSAAERDLEEIFRRADADGNEEITFDELYQLLTGQPIDPLIEPIAREWTILKNSRTAESKWESWGSLLLAPQVRKLSTANAATRRFFDQASKRAEELYGEFNNGAWKDEAWWRQDLIPQSRLSVNVPEETDDDEHQRRREDGNEGGRHGRRSKGWRRPWRWLRGGRNRADRTP